MTLELDITQFHDVLVLCARHILGSRKDTEDIVQEVYVKIMAREGLDFDSPHALKAYLVRAVHNLCLDRIERKDALRRTVEIIDREVMEEVMDFDDQLLSEVRARVEGLPARTQRVIQLIFVEGMRYKEAAAAMGITENTVKTLVRNGLNSLRSHFGGRMMTYLLLI